MTITRNGKKMYPVGKWSKWQVAFYNNEAKCRNKMVEDDYSDEAIANADEATRLLELFEFGPQDADGMVYAEYADYKMMKDVIEAYRFSHRL